MSDAFVRVISTFRRASDVSAAALATFGRVNQLGMVQEECAELIAAINRWARRRAMREEVVTEIADVIIVAFCAAHVFGLYDVVEEIDRKLDRLQARIERHGVKSASDLSDRP